MIALRENGGAIFLPLHTHKYYGIIMVITLRRESMREIKFRGKRIDGNHNWVYGSLITNKNKYFIVVDGNLEIGYNNTLGNTSIQEVIPETVGQFTGLHDKNGKELFESDNISASENVHHGRIDGVVFWKVTGWYVKDIITEDDIYLDCCSNIEIIGNIYENPELSEATNGKQ
jgi:uncharacterized phage protein (TIGR01671 family)